MIFYMRFHCGQNLRKNSEVNTTCGVSNKAFQHGKINIPSSYGSGYEQSEWLPNVCIVQVSMSESRRPQHTSGTGCMTLGIRSQEKIIYCSTFARKSKWVIVAYFWAWISKFSLKTMIVKSKVWRRHDPMNTKSRAINLLFGFC